MKTVKLICALFLCIAMMTALTLPAMATDPSTASAEETTMLAAGEKTITVTTNLADGTKVIRVPSYETYAKATSAVEEATVSGGKASFDRYTESGFDKIYETYYFVLNGNVQVGPLYVTEIDALNDYPRPQTTSIKGLQVQNVDDAQKLGAQHAAMNFNLNELFYASKPSNMNSAIEFTSNGKTYYMRKSMVEQYDHDIKTLSDNGMEVTLIMILWGWQGGGLGTTPKDLIHPGYLAAMDKGMVDPVGRIAAVNTTTQAGIEYWIAAMEFAVERYTREDQAYGRAVNFIISNEVNSQVVWNCIGEMPIDQYVEEYSRTFRLAYNAAKSKYANASVLISMDYCWTAVAFPGTYSENYQYPGKDVLEKFAAKQKQWGDIGWNLAYHPYPENLFDPVFWEDVTATDDPVTTPKITFKNLELLPQIMKGENFLYKGEPRRIMLTEQGFHTPDPTSIEDQKIQAAAYAYAYYKIYHMKEIDAFILHRHVDILKEDGLKVGLWTMKDGTETSPGVKKYIWDVFKYIDTERSEAVTEFAKEILKIQNWNELITNFDISGIDAGTLEFGIRGESGIAIDPKIEVSDFETDMNGWQVSEHGKDAEVTANLFSGPYTPFKGNNSLQVSFNVSTYNGGGYAEKGVVKTFENGLDLTGSNYKFVYAITAPTGYADNATLTTTVRFYSGRHVAQSVIRLTPEEWNTIRVDISNWEYKDSIDKIKIWVETNTTDLYNGKFAIDSVGFEMPAQEEGDVQQPGQTAPATDWGAIAIIGGLCAALVATVVAIVIVAKKKNK